MTQRVVPYCEPGENLRSNPVRWAASPQNQAHFAATEIARFASPGDPRHPEAKCFRGVFGPNHRGVLASCLVPNNAGKSGMDDQEQELERKLERALDALVWGRRQPDFSSNDRTKLLSDVTDARIELWEYHRSQKATAT